MELNITGPKIYFTIPILGGIPITQTTVSSLLVTILLCVAGAVLGKKLTKRPGRAQVMVEKGVSTLYSLVEETMGVHNSHWTPFIGTLFLSSMLGSFIGMTGFLRSSTADLSTTLTWAVMVSVLIWYNSIKANGFLGWLKGFTEPIVVMTPMNLISEVAQPISMAFRHFGNVAGGGVITSVLYLAMSGLSSLLIGLVASNGVAVCIASLVIGAFVLFMGFRKKKMGGKVLGYIFIVVGLFALLEVLGVATGIPILDVGLPAILSLYFDVFSGVIQAFVFSLLTMIYVSSACPAPEEAA